MQNSQQGSSEKREQLSALHRSLSQKQERTLFSVAEIRHLSDAACRNVSNSPDRLAMLARRSGAALKLVHVVEPYSLYQRLSHTLTEPYSQEELAQKAGQQLEACADSLIRETQKNALSVEYEVRAGKPFVELILVLRSLSSGAAR